MKASRSHAISMESFFRQQAVRWSLVGFLLTVAFAIPCVLYSAKLASERQVLLAARTAARAFRPMILEEGNVRDAELKMREALQLKDGESAIVREPNLSASYPLQESDAAPRCSHPNAYCWSSGFKAVTTLYPIYFDDQKQESLFGYLEVTLKPSLDVALLSILVFLLFAAFIGQAFGLSSALNRCAKSLSAQLGRWAEHLEKSPEIRPQSLGSISFTELEPMKVAVDGLHIEIEKLREKSAKDAKAQAQLAMLREVSHDLKTPHSLLAKYFALHLDTVQSTGQVNPLEVSRFQGTLKRMGDLLRQVRTMPGTQVKSANPTCDLVIEAKSIIEDLRHDSEVAAKEIAVEAHYDNDVPQGKVSALGFYRILENLFRNAVEAVKIGGRVVVSVRNIDGKPALVVKDNGCGITPELQAKIFEFDFTTKLARGTGLGLGIVDQLCKEFGAKINLNSNPGEGAEFTILFAAVEATPSVAPFEEVSHAQI